MPRTSWLSSLGQDGQLTETSRLLAGVDAAGCDNGRLVCTCWEVGERQILRAVEQGACSVQDLGKALRCGTQCGSCVPELRQFLNRGSDEQAA